MPIRLDTQQMAVVLGALRQVATARGAYSPSSQQQRGYPMVTAQSPDAAPPCKLRHR